MAKQSMIQREVKREYLISKYASKRTVLKKELKTDASFKEKIQIYKHLVVERYKQKKI